MAHPENETLEPSEYAPSHEPYISLVPPGSVLDFLESQRRVFGELLSGVDARQADFRYAPGKWSFKEVVGHVTDSERIQAYRALCIARGEPQPLPGFEENDYAKNSDLSGVAMEKLSEQLDWLRRADLLLFHSLTPEAWRRQGVANKTNVSVRAQIHILAGHAQHHLEILRTRYLLAPAPPAEFQKSSTAE